MVSSLKSRFQDIFSLILQGLTMDQNTSNAWATLAKRPFVVNPMFVKFDGNLLNLCEICSNCDAIHTYTDIFLSYLVKFRQILAKFSKFPSNLTNV